MPQTLLTNVAWSAILTPRGEPKIRSEFLNSPLITMANWCCCGVFKESFLHTHYGCDIFLPTIVIIHILILTNKQSSCSARGLLLPDFCEVLCISLNIVYVGWREGGGGVPACMRLAGNTHTHTRATERRIHGAPFFSRLQDVEEAAAATVRVWHPELFRDSPKEAKEKREQTCIAYFVVNKVKNGSG